MDTEETRLIRIHARGPADPSLGVLQKRAARIDPRLPPVLLIHGATFGAGIFDLPRAGYSLMTDLAARGRTVYALDVRGYGNSRGAAMPATEQPLPRFPLLTDVVNDIGTAVTAICDRERTDAVDLAGFSWGAMTSARYATEHPHKVARLALYAPIYCEVNRAWLRRIADPDHPDRINAGLGAYRLITQADVTERWDFELGSGDPTLYRDSRLPELLFDAMAALDPWVRSNGRPAFRCPTGALVDMFRAFSGHPAYDPAALTMPTLIIRGADDTTSTDSDAVRLLAAISSGDKDYRTIAPGSHFLLVERNRGALYGQLAHFFERGRR